MYKHISKLIEILVQAGNSNKSISEAIGRSASTILWEIRRNYTSKTMSEPFLKKQFPSNTTSAQFCSGLKWSRATAIVFIRIKILED